MYIHIPMEMHEYRHIRAVVLESRNYLRDRYVAVFFLVSATDTSHNKLTRKNIGIIQNYMYL